jgi:hypothetical protein
MTVTLARLYADYEDACAAVRNLEDAGLSPGDISIVANNSDNRFLTGPGQTVAVDGEPRADRDKVGGAETGASVGAALGGLAGLLAGLGVIAIPGIGPVVAAGWLIATAAGVTAGSLAGGILGALTQAGVSKEDAGIYAEGLRRGGAVVSARVNDTDAARIQIIMDRSAVDIRERGAAYRQTGWQSFDPGAAPYTPEQVRLERELYGGR